MASVGRPAESGRLTRTTSLNAIIAATNTPTTRAGWLVAGHGPGPRRGVTGRQPGSGPTTGAAVSGSSSRPAATASGGA